MSWEKAFIEDNIDLMYGGQEMEMDPLDNWSFCPYTILYLLISFQEEKILWHGSRLTRPFWHGYPVNLT